METPSDSDQSRRERRKTSAEIFFDEEPVFSDSEEEAEFLRLTFGTCEDDMSASENCDPQVSNPLLESILEVCCRKCICCRRILLLFRPSEDSPVPNHTLSSSKCLAGFRLGDYSTPPKNHEQQSVQKQSSSKKVNVVSHHIIPPSGALLSLNTNSSNQIDSKHVLPNFASSDSLGDKAKRTMRKRKSFHSKKAKKRLNQAVEVGEGSNGQSGATNKLSESTNGLRNQDLQSDNVATNNYANVKNSSDNDRRVGKTQESIGNKINAANTTQSRPAKKARKGKRKSMPNMISVEESTASESQSRSLIAVANHEPQKSPRELESKMENGSETVLNGSIAKRKSAQLKKRKSVYSTIDKRVFKMTIDTTADRGLVNAVTRKLARKGGSSLGLGLFSVQNASFRLQATQKLKKLYSPTGWLNSPLFERICKHDV